MHFHYLDSLLLLFLFLRLSLPHQLLYPLFNPSLTSLQAMLRGLHISILARNGPPDLLAHELCDLGLLISLDLHVSGPQPFLLDLPHKFLNLALEQLDLALFGL